MKDALFFIAKYTLKAVAQKYIVTLKKVFFTNLSTEQCKQNSYTPLLLYPILGTASYARPILC